jgi:hypothetical protein
MKSIHFISFSSDTIVLSLYLPALRLFSGATPGHKEIDIWITGTYQVHVDPTIFTSTVTRKVGANLNCGDTATNVFANTHMKKLNEYY